MTTYSRSPRSRRATYDDYRPPSNANMPPYGGAAQLPSVYGGYTPSAKGSPSVYSNVTGFRKSLTVVGCPDRNYFTNKLTAPNDQSPYSNQPQNNYAPSQLTPPNQPGRPLFGQMQNSPPDVYDDNATVLPQDSISQVSSNRSVPRSSHSRRSNHPQRRDSIVSGSYASSFGGPRSVFEGSQVYDDAKGYYVVERRPPGSRK